MSLDEVEKPWAMFAPTVEGMVRPALENIRSAMARRADATDTAIGALSDRIGQLADGQRRITDLLADLERSGAKSSDELRVLAERMRTMSADVAEVRADVAALGREVHKIADFHKWLGDEAAAQGATVRQTGENVDELLGMTRDVHVRLNALETRLRDSHRGAWIVGMLCLIAGVLAVGGVLVVM
jgi:chromosome segregation ATPase